MGTPDIQAFEFRPDVEAERWKALADRDPRADGTFVYSVRTTGVYCRPSCSARRPRPENIAFHASNVDAERSGFRPCKRCRPDQASQGERHAAAVARACRVIEGAETLPKLGDLAAAAGLSAYHFHRIFKKTTGVTPKAYATQNRSARVRSALRTAETITHAIYEAGFNAPSRFYENAPERLGMTPSAYRDRGAGTIIRFAVGECSLGSILVAATDKGVCAIDLGDDPNLLAQSLQDRFGNATIVGGDPAFEAIVATVVGLIETPQRSADLPLDISGTAFQHRVWAALRAIPAGTTATYAEIAATIGQPKAVRAVAAACGANPLAVAIPCHRVIRTDGSISGYRWGVARKKALLAREKTSR